MACYSMEWYRQILLPLVRPIRPFSFRYLKWAMASPVANHFCANGNASQESHLMSHVIRDATSKAD